jgi:hypothetical protein
MSVWRIGECMAKELFEYNGDYYYFDDATGKIIRVVLKEDVTITPELMKAAIDADRKIRANYK